MNETTGVVPVMDLNANRGYGYGDGFGFGGNGAFWIIALMAMMGFGGGWGNNGWNNGAVTQSDIFLNGNATRNEINSGFNHAETQADVRMMNAQMVDGMHDNIISNLQGFNGVQRDILASGNATQREMLGAFNNLQMANAAGFNALNTGLMENRFATQRLGCEQLRAVDNLRADAYQNTCNIINSINANAEETRALIVQNQIQELRDRLADKDRTISTLQVQAGTAAQTQMLVGALRPYPQPAYLVSSPYTGITIPTTGTGDATTTG